MLSANGTRETHQASRIALFTRGVLIAVGFGAGASALFSAYYSPSLWVPIGFVAAIAAAAAAIIRPPRATLPIGLSLAGVAGLGLWSLLSSSWAHGVEQATVSANLWLAYATLLLLLVVLLRGIRDAELLLAACGLGIAVVAASVLIRMLGPDPATLFVAGRLNSPLGAINGEACLFGMGCWLFLSVAERDEPWAAGAGMAGTVALAGLALLSESRGVAIASFAAVAVALVAVPGIRRRVLALTVVAAAVAAAAGALLNVYAARNGGIPAAVIHHAAVAIVLSSVAAGLAWAGLTATVTRLRATQPAEGVDRLATGVTVVILAAPVVALLARLSTVVHTIRSQWHSFVDLSTSASSSSTAVQTRLLSGGGNRYDYWRVAWHVFTAHPLAGVGAGNYTPYYYLYRRTQESIQNPHSIELQTLAELGLVGGVLLALLIAGVVVGARRLRSAARTSRRERTLMLGATGSVVVWLVNTSGDWIHLLPGVTAVTLAAAAVLCHGNQAQPVVADRARSRTRAASLAGAVVVGFVLVVGGASLLRSELVNRDVSNAHSELSASPAATIHDAQSALSLDSADLDAYYLEAAGQARFDRGAAARATLLAAAHEDPQAFVTWTLLGDLEVRLGHLSTARSYYERAHQLVPSDPYLARLAVDPRDALTPFSST